MAKLVKYLVEHHQTILGRYNTNGELEFFLPFDHLRLDMGLQPDHILYVPVRPNQAHQELESEPVQRPHLWVWCTDNFMGLQYQQCDRCMTLKGEPGDETCPL
jgi:hypothetical protein